MEDATALADAIAGGQLSAREAVAASWDAAQAAPDLVARLLPRSEALAELSLSGPFAGVPCLAKDLGSFARGLAPAGGCEALRTILEDPSEDSDLMAGFRASGLVPIGLSRVPEFGFALSCDPPDGGAGAPNPFDARLSAGGSSGGAAAAVAQGVVAIAHATDAAGSIRVPAACCGLWGLKPSRGAVPGGPDYGNHLMGVASELVVARSLRDVTTAFDTVALPAPLQEPSGRRIAIMVPDQCDATQRDAVRCVADHLSSEGCDVSEATKQDKALIADLGQHGMTCVARILAVSLADWLDAYSIPNAAISPLSAANAERGRAMSGPQTFALSRELQQISHRAARMFERMDALLMPVLSGPPPGLGAFPFDHTDVDRHIAAMSDLAPNAALANAAGLPALAFPAGLWDGLPVGVQLMGPMGSDRSLLDIAARLVDRLPPIPYPAPICGFRP